MSRRSLFLAVLLVPCLAVPLHADVSSEGVSRQVAEVDFWAVKAIEKVGGKVVRDPWREGQPVIAVDLTHSEVTDTLLKTVATCKHIQSLDLTNCQGVTDAGMKELSSCKQLLSLSLRFCTNITDAGIKELSACEQLQSLDLHNCFKVTDEALKALTACQQLRSLHVGGCSTGVTDAGLKELVKLKQLRSLSVFHCGK